MPPGVNALRDAILDAIDARDTLVHDVAETGLLTARLPAMRVVVAAALPGATEHHQAEALRHPEWQRAVMEALVHAALRADAHAVEHSAALRAASPGRDEGPVRRSHLEARRALRGIMGPTSG